MTSPDHLAVVLGKELKMWVLRETGCDPLFCPRASCLSCFPQIDHCQGDSASLLDDSTQVGCIGQHSRCVHMVGFDLRPPKTQIIECWILKRGFRKHIPFFVTYERWNGVECTRG